MCLSNQAHLQVTLSFSEHILLFVLKWTVAWDCLFAHSNPSSLVIKDLWYFWSRPTNCGITTKITSFSVLGKCAKCSWAYTPSTPSLLQRTHRLRSVSLHIVSDKFDKDCKILRTTESQFFQKFFLSIELKFLASTLNKYSKLFCKFHRDRAHTCGVIRFLQNIFARSLSTLKIVLRTCQAHSSSFCVLAEESVSSFIMSVFIISFLIRVSFNTCHF